MNNFDVDLNDAEDGIEPSYDVDGKGKGKGKKWKKVGSQGSDVDGGKKRGQINFTDASDGEIDQGQAAGVNPQ